jgi:hypothetical protein
LELKEWVFSNESFELEWSQLNLEVLEIGLPCLKGFLIFLIGVPSHLVTF